MSKPEASTSTRTTVSITVSGDRDPQVISFLKSNYGVSRLPIKIMDAVNAFFLVFTISCKKNRGEAELIGAAQESITLLEAHVRSILWKLNSEGVDTSWYTPMDSPKGVAKDLPLTLPSRNKTVSNGRDDGFTVDIT
jgi:hypothetical protein